MSRVLAGLLGLLLGPAAAAGITVEDDTGRSVRLATPAQRIVSLSPHATELVFAAGAGGRIVATVEHSDEPPEAKAIPRVGGLAGVDREALLAAAPDLVVAWESGNPPRLLAWLERRGIAVYRSEPRRLADLDRSVADLAALAGLAPRTPPPEEPIPIPARPVRALYLFWDSPPIAAGEDHVLADLLRSCGAVPAIPGLPGKAATLSPEALLGARADLLLTTDGRVLVPRDGGSARERFVPLRVDEAERLALQAAQRPGPRLHLARAAVCARIAARASGRVPFSP